MKRHKILIVGGYGKVGLAAAKNMIAAGANDLIVAGRNKASAEAAARDLGHGAIGRVIDIQKGKESLKGFEDVSTVLCCVDQVDTRFVEACISESLHYIDVTADDRFHRLIEEFTSAAKRSGSRVLLSVGLAPGLSNLMANEVFLKDESTKAVDISILLGLGEKHGAAAIDWTIDQVFAEPKLAAGPSSLLVSFGKELGRQRCYSFDFSDQHALMRSLSGRSVHTRLTFESKVVTALIPLLRRFRFLSFLKRFLTSSIILSSQRFMTIGSEAYAIHVRSSDESRPLTGLLSGHGEASLTGAIAAAMTLSVRDMTQAGGVYHSHELFRIDDFANILDQEKATLSWQ